MAVLHVHQIVRVTVTLDFGHDFTSRTRRFRRLGLGGELQRQFLGRLLRLGLGGFGFALPYFGSLRRRFWSFFFWRLRF